MRRPQIRPSRPTRSSTISTTARAALADVRLLLTQLRHSQRDGPQPTLADLEELYAQVRAAGVELRVDVDPAPAARARRQRCSSRVYRILQEALTNALRHGDGGRSHVRLAWLPTVCKGSPASSSRCATASSPALGRASPGTG